MAPDPGLAKIILQIQLVLLQTLCASLKPIPCPIRLDDLLFPAAPDGPAPPSTPQGSHHVDPGPAPGAPPPSRTQVVTPTVLAVASSPPVESEWPALQRGVPMHFPPSCCQKPNSKSLPRSRWGPACVWMTVLCKVNSVKFKSKVMVTSALRLPPALQ